MPLTGLPAGAGGCTVGDGAKLQESLGCRSWGGTPRRNRNATAQWPAFSQALMAASQVRGEEAGGDEAFAKPRSAEGEQWLGTLKYPGVP